MKLCKQAAQTDCGKNICCFECEQKETCDLACQFKSNEGCENAYDEETALQEFNKDNNAVAIMKQIAAISKQKKELEDQEKKVRESLEAAMEQYGIKSFDNDILKVTYVAPTTKTTVDSKKLKKEQPEIFAKYSNVSNVKASVRITVKE